MHKMVKTLIVHEFIEFCVAVYLHVGVMEDLAHPLCSLYPLTVVTDLTFEIFVIFL